VNQIINYTSKNDTEGRILNSPIVLCLLNLKKNQNYLIFTLYRECDIDKEDIILLIMV